MARSDDTRIGLVRVAYADGLFKLLERDNGTKYWGCTLLFPKSDKDTMAKLEHALVQASKEEWGDKAIQMIKDGIIKSPILDGDGKQGKSKQTGEPHAGFPGNYFIRVISGEEYRPQIVDRQRMPILSRDKLYSGCYVYAVINAFTWESKEQGKGLTFGLSAVQFARDGDRLGGGGGVDVNKHFDVIEDEGEAPESTKSDGAGGLFG